MTTPPHQPPAPEARAFRLALISAEGEAALEAALEAARAAPPPKGGPPARLGAGVGARHRAALLLDEGGSPRPTALAPSAVEGAPRPVAFLFPGLGDQYLHMGLGLYQREPAFRDTIDRCAELLRPELGLDLRSVLYPKRDAAPAPAAGLDLRKMLGRGDKAAKDPDEQRLARTSIAQPALFAVEYALAALWQSWGLRHDSALGYSLGEYVAACLAGVLSLEDSLSLVARRAQLIESLPEGAMLAVSLPEAEAEPLLGEHLSVAAVNGPDLTVVAGPPEEAHALEKRLAERGVAARRVKSSHAFHSKMMRPIADAVKKLAGAYSPKPPRTPYVSNVTGAPITDAQAQDPAYWATHLCRPVRFADGLRALAARPGRVLLEAGPGQTLSSLATLGAEGAKGQTAVASMRHAYDAQPDEAVLLKALARLWLAGADLDWARFPAHRAEGAPPEAAPKPHTPEGADGPTETERKLAELWQPLLAGRPVPRDGNFFELGGNSLLATRLIYRVSKAFKVELSVRRVYEVPTLAAMAAAVDGLREHAAAPRGEPER